VRQQKSRAKFRRLGGRAGLDVQLAQVLTYLALGAFGASVALGWYGPQQSTDLVRLTTTSDVVVCGTLVQSGVGTLQVDSTTVGSTVVKLSAVACLSVVESCDESLGGMVGHVWTAASETRDSVASEATTGLKSPDPAAAARLAGSLGESPIGVLEALDTDRGWLDDAWPFGATIPAELTAFLELSPSERARALARAAVVGAHQERMRRPVMRWGSMAM